MTESNLKEGDLVIVSGETLKKGAPEQAHYALARVLAVGEYDIFASTEEARPAIYRISKSRCTLVPKLDVKKDEVKNAVMGNLVMSITDRFGKIEKKMGVIMEINRFPGKSPIVKILDGDKEHTVPYDSLIVLGAN